MTKKHNVFKENEMAANQTAAKVMLVSFILFTMIYILNVVGFFVVKQHIMNLAYILGSIFLLIPYILVKKFNNHKWYVKYLLVLAAAMFIALTTMTLAFHIVVLFGLPILIASIYFDKKLINAAIIMTVVLTSITQWLYYNLDFVADLNFYTPKKFIMFAIFPRGLGVVFFGWIAKKIVARAGYILGSLMSAEEQSYMMKKNETIKQKAADVSVILDKTVMDLEESTTKVLNTNNVVSKESKEVLHNTSQNVTNITKVNDNFTEIAANIKDLDSRTEKISSLAQNVKVLTNENQDLITLATNKMLEVNDSSDICKNKIEDLEKQSKEISKILDLISDISDQTQLLSLNASIEAARAGEQGKGFMVVAEEINNLSNQTKTALDNIGTVVSNILNGTTDAVQAAEKSTEKTKEGLQNIKDALNASIEITNSNVLMTSDINEVYNITKTITKNSIDIASYLNEIKVAVDNNYSMINNVSNTINFTTESTNVLIEVVDSIKNVSEELNTVVNS